MLWGNSKIFSVIKSIIVFLKRKNFNSEAKTNEINKKYVPPPISHLHSLLWITLFFKSVECFKSELLFGQPWLELSWRCCWVLTATDSLWVLLCVSADLQLTSFAQLLETSPGTSDWTRGVECPACGLCKSTKSFGLLLPQRC